MIFYRSAKGPTDRSASFVRRTSAAALVAYPAGALTLALGADGVATSVIGFGLILVSLICFALLTGSSAQRIVGEETTQLDEYELQLRYRSISMAHTLFTVLVLCAIIYAAVATDKGGWLPSTYDHYNGLFWGTFLYASTLPTACLVWRFDLAADAEMAA